MDIGLIGLGVMGCAIGGRLLESGFPLRIYNRTKDKCAPLLLAGAHSEDSPAEVVSASQVVICILPDTPDVEKVLFGKQGIAEGELKGKIVIDMSTVSPNATTGFAARLQEMGCAMLDAPVSGGEQGAKAGMLSIMVGGEMKAFETCLPVLRVLGKSVVYFGGHGAGQKAKLVNQVVGSLNLLATVEGLRLAKSVGLDLEATREVVANGAASSWMLVNLGAKIIQGDFLPGFRIALQAKDLRLANALAQEMNLDLPGLRLVSSVLEQALKLGLAEQGNQGIWNVWESESPRSL